MICPVLAVKNRYLHLMNMPWKSRFRFFFLLEADVYDLLTIGLLKLMVRCNWGSATIEALKKAKGSAAPILKKTGIGFWVLQKCHTVDYF